MAGLGNVPGVLDAAALFVVVGEDEECARPRRRDGRRCGGEEHDGGEHGGDEHHDHEDDVLTGPDLAPAIAKALAASLAPS